MAPKLTTEGFLIYAAMALYLVAAVALARKARRAGGLAFGLGFATAAVAFALRWVDVQHVPLQNLYEVFLCLGMLVPPISYLCHRYLRIGAAAVDAVIGAVVLFPAGFVFDGEPQQLPPALQSDLFAPHVAAYMAAYVLMAKATVQAALHLVGSVSKAPGLVDHELGAYKMVRLGFPLLSLGLVLGAVWGKLAWGDYWNWDPKELWSFASWLLFAGYLHFRHLYGQRFPRANAWLVTLGMVAIAITLLWVNLGRIFGGLHSYATA
jgi:ABC-type transport system involved in cytochrome c biogenesis permease subunit